MHGAKSLPRVTPRSYQCFLLLVARPAALGRGDATGVGFGQHHGPKFFAGGQPIEFTMDLHRQLPGGRHDNGPWTTTSTTTTTRTTGGGRRCLVLFRFWCFQHRGQQGQEKGTRFAGTRGRHGKDVAPFGHARHGLHLNGGGFFVLGTFNVLQQQMHNVCIVLRWQYLIQTVKGFHGVGHVIALDMDFQTFPKRTNAFFLLQKGTAA